MVMGLLRLFFEFGWEGLEELFVGKGGLGVGGLLVVVIG